MTGNNKNPLRSTRRSRDHTQDIVSWITTIHPSTMSRIENWRKMPSDLEFAQIVTYCRVPKAQRRQFIDDWKAEYSSRRRAFDRHNKVAQ